MPAETKGIQGKSGDVLLMVGTTKGAFLYHRNGGGWEVDGPHFPGEEVYAISADTRGGTTTVWAAPGSAFFGTTLRRSDDLGGSWTGKEAHPVKFPEDSELALKRIWQIMPGRADQPDTIFLGVEPSCLFESRDGGATFAPVDGFLNHEHREFWQPGNGGLCMHTIVPDPASHDRMLVAFSTGGVYRTDDGGASWRPRNVGVRAEFMPDKHPEYGQCVHKVVHHPSRPERLFLQNHWGLYRSDDWGEEWMDIAHGVPSDFGFAMAMHPHDPDTVYIVPLEGDFFRCTPEAKMRVYRTRNAGESWEPLAEGLPQEGAYETVLRDALDTAPTENGSVFFGTRSGKVFASDDSGDHWQVVADGIPPVVCVKSVVLP